MCLWASDGGREVLSCWARCLAQVPAWDAEGSRSIWRSFCGYVVERHLELGYYVARKLPVVEIPRVLIERECAAGASGLQQALWMVNPRLPGAPGPVLGMAATVRGDSTT